MLSAGANLGVYRDTAVAGGKRLYIPVWVTGGHADGGWEEKGTDGQTEQDSQEWFAGLVEKYT